MCYKIEKYIIIQSDNNQIKKEKANEKKEKFYFIKNICILAIQNLSRILAKNVTKTNSIYLCNQLIIRL